MSHSGAFPIGKEASSVTSEASDGNHKTRTEQTDHRIKNLWHIPRIYSALEPVTRAWMPRQLPEQGAQLELLAGEQQALAHPTVEPLPPVRSSDGQAVAGWPAVVILVRRQSPAGWINRVRCLLSLLGFRLPVQIRGIPLTSHFIGWCRWTKCASLPLKEDHTKQWGGITPTAESILKPSICEICLAGS